MSDSTASASADEGQVSTGKLSVAWEEDEKAKGALKLDRSRGRKDGVAQETGTGRSRNTSVPDEYKGQDGHTSREEIERWEGDKRAELDTRKETSSSSTSTNHSQPAKKYTSISNLPPSRQPPSPRNKDLTKTPIESVQYISKVLDVILSKYQGHRQSTALPSFWLQTPEVTFSYLSGKLDPPPFDISPSLPRDYTPAALLFSNEYRQLRAESWAREFTSGCCEVAERAFGKGVNGLACRYPDRESYIEDALCREHNNLWHLSGVFTGQRRRISSLDPNVRSDSTGQPNRKREMLCGGVVFHEVAIPDLEPNDGMQNSFLPGELECGLAIIAHQILHQAGAETQVEVEHYSARIASLTSTLLRVLVIQYNSRTNTLTCYVLKSCSLSFDSSKMDQLDRNWLQAMQAVLEIKEGE